jgi:hypothetical protein
MRLLLSTVIVLSIFISCKKDDPNPESPFVPYTPTSSGTMGDLQTGYYIYDYGHGVVTTDSMVIASFFSAPATSVTPTNISAGTVSLNGTTLKYNAPQNYYSDTTHHVNMQQLNWNATGAGTVAAFSYSYTPIYPKCTGGFSTLDTCIKANGIGIALNGISNVTSNVTIALYQGVNTISKTITAPNGSVYFTPSELSSFAVNVPLTINILLVNLANANVGSVNYGFVNTLTYNKFSYLK